MRPRVKLCGMTRVEDVRAAVAAGADYVGFVLVESSRRRVMPSVLGELIAAAAPARPVCVIADEALTVARRLASAHPSLIMQLHGRESAKYAQALAADGVEVWKAVVLRDDDDLRRYADFPASRLVVDAAQGGSGRLCDWRLASAMASRRPVLLAGGIGPGNAVTAWRTTGAWGLDIASGVEDAPGIKSTEKINELMAALRSLNKSLSEKHKWVLRGGGKGH
ncbi:MAG: phosphoribosylanthranilate isomerase [Lentisphaerae bacterium]|nr:phosphoribosylanthranilate isomerase [Lentisphaerota bacterium]